MARKAFVSYQAKVELAMRDIGVAVVTAVAIQITNDAKLEARGGFKGGAFVTRGWQGIRWAVIDQQPPRALVGHHERHFMFWEMGHHNAWTRQYERNQWLSRGFTRDPPAQNRAADLAARATAAKYFSPVSPLVRKP